MRYGEASLLDGIGTPIIRTYYSGIPVGRREYRAHFHAECELSTFLCGSGIYTVGDRAYPFSAGDVFVFSSNEPHCITEVHEAFELLNIHFLPSLLLSHSGDVELMRIFFARSGAFENRVNPTHPCTELLHTKIRAVARELAEQRTGYKVQALCELLCACVVLNRDYGYIDESVSYRGLMHTVGNIDAALRYIHAHIDEPLTLKDIAAAASLTSTYFSTVFKRINGITPWKYITIKRVEKAIELIRTTDLTKLDIAMRCGFTCSSNFYKAFSAITGKAPKEYDPNRGR